MSTKNFICFVYENIQILFTCYFWSRNLVSEEKALYCICIALPFYFIQTDRKYFIYILFIFRVLK